MLVTLLALEATEENKRLDQAVNQYLIKIIVFS
jgi:L-asparagine transporter-like permease